MLRTCLHTYGKCPTWNIDICITGIYNILSEPNDNTARFCISQCPILLNQNLPPQKRDPKYIDYSFCNHEENCKLLKDFPAIIDVATHKPIE